MARLALETNLFLAPPVAVAFADAAFDCGLDLPSYKLPLLSKNAMVSMGPLRVWTLPVGITVVGLTLLLLDKGDESFVPDRLLAFRFIKLVEFKTTTVPKLVPTQSCELYC